MRHGDAQLLPLLGLELRGPEHELAADEGEGGDVVVAEEVVEAERLDPLLQPRAVRTQVLVVVLRPQLPRHLQIVEETMHNLKAV